MHMPVGDNLEINLLAANQHRADHNREAFDAWRLLSLNVMSSPGAGKTALLERSLPLLAQERYAEVEKAAFDILNVDYYNYFGNLRLCYALRMQEKFDVAEKVSLKMLTVYPVDIAFLTEYALTKVGQGDMAAALRVFANIRILDPENPTAKQYLGL